MRVVVTGATGNIGTSLVRALVADRKVTEVVGLARHVPGPGVLGASWRRADVCVDDLAAVFAGADAVVHLAWAVQPSRHVPALERVNVAGSERVAQAVAQAGVPVLVHASSLGAYSPGPKDHPVGEAHPVGGLPGFWYSQHKAAVERMLDAYETEHPDVRVVRMRPAFVLKGESARRVRQAFTGPLLPRWLLHPALLPMVPATARLRLQVLHADDTAEGFRLALHRPVRGAFNLAADPVLDGAELGRLLRALPVPVPAAALRAAAGISYRLRLQPSPPAWVDLVLSQPLLDVSRARDELGWQPRYDAGAVVLEALDGLRRDRHGPTPALASRQGARLRDLLTGIGTGDQAAG